MEEYFEHDPDVALLYFCEGSGVNCHDQINPNSLKENVLNDLKPLDLLTTYFFLYCMWNFGI